MGCQRSQGTIEGYNNCSVAILRATSDVLVVLRIATEQFLETFF